MDRTESRERNASSLFSPNSRRTNSHCRNKGDVQARLAEIYPVMARMEKYCGESRDVVCDDTRTL